MNAIILAAGMGTRLRPLTDNTPKSLIEVNGQPIIERQIEYLQAIGIDEITVVTGYLHEQFDYLIDKYGVELLYNDKYDVYNNGYTMYLVRELLRDSLVLEGDVYPVTNFLLSDLNHSTYFCGDRNEFSNEWLLTFNDDNDIVDINVKSGTGYIMSGVSYWTVEDGKKIKEMLEDMVASGGFENLFWDDLVKDNLKDFNIKIHKIRSNDWVEIDSVEDLKLAEDVENKSCL